MQFSDVQAVNKVCNVETVNKKVSEWRIQSKQSLNHKQVGGILIFSCFLIFACIIRRVRSLAFG